MNQTKKGSFAEAITNILIGYFVALLSQIVIFPLVGVEASFDQNILIGLLFTIVSLLRSYTVRRIYNRYNFFNK